MAAMRIAVIGAGSVIAVVPTKPLLWRHANINVDPEAW